MFATEPGYGGQCMRPQHLFSSLSGVHWEVCVLIFPQKAQIERVWSHSNHTDSLREKYGSHASVFQVVVRRPLLIEIKAIQVCLDALSVIFPSQKTLSISCSLG